MEGSHQSHQSHQAHQAHQALKHLKHTKHSSTSSTSSTPSSTLLHCQVPILKTYLPGRKCAPSVLKCVVHCAHLTTTHWLPTECPWWRFFATTNCFFSGAPCLSWVAWPIEFSPMFDSLKIQSKTALVLIVLVIVAKHQN